MFELDAMESAYILGIADEIAMEGLFNFGKKRREKKEAQARERELRAKRCEELIDEWKPEHDKIVNYCKAIYKKLKAKYPHLYFEPEFIKDDGYEIIFFPQGEYGVEPDEYDNYDDKADEIYKCYHEFESLLVAFIKPLAKSLYKKSGNGIYLRKNYDHIGFNIEVIDGSEEFGEDNKELQKYNGFLNGTF